MQNDILFDNIYIGHSVEDAEKLKAETFDIKHPIEKKEDDASLPEPKKPDSPMDLKFKDDPIHYMREKFDLFMTIAKNDPVQAIKFVPEVAGALAVLALTTLAALVGLFTMGSSSPQVKKAAEKVKDAAIDAKDQAVDATASGVEKVQAEVQKRTTRSTDKTVQEPTTS